MVFDRDCDGNFLAVILADHATLGVADSALLTRLEYVVTEVDEESQRRSLQIALSPSQAVEYGKALQAAGEAMMGSRRVCAAGRPTR